MKTNSENIANKEIFVLDRPTGGCYLYAPLNKKLIIANNDAACIVAGYCSGKSYSPGSKEQDLIDAFIKEGVIGDHTPDLPLRPESFKFCPHEVTLFLTSRCNLNCRYCYADADSKSVDMPWNVAKAAIDFAAHNAGLLGNKSFAVGFHGGGEPMITWNMLVECCNYAKFLSDQKGLDVELFAATNGVLSPDKCEYITCTFNTVNVSLDGPADIHNYNRTMKNGDGSYKTVRETLKYFDNVGFHYGIRATVTAKTVSHMEESVDHICSTFRPAYLHVEPSWFCGRCFNTHELPPDDDDFVDHFLRAKAKGEEYGISVHYSGARLDVLSSTFCGAPGDSFAVLPEGIVTSCYEITDLSDPRAHTFHYGQYDSQAGSFCFDQDRIDTLQRLSVENLPFCESCFCRWHCAGDCIAKAFNKSGSIDHNGTERCNINRKLLFAALADIAEKSDD